MGRNGHGAAGGEEHLLQVAPWRNIWQNLWCPGCRRGVQCWGAVFWSFCPKVLLPASVLSRAMMWFP